MTHRRAIEVDEFLPHPPARVWAALTDPARLGAWFMPNDFAPEVGHRFTLDTGRWDITECEVLEVDAPRLLRFSWRNGPLAPRSPGGSCAKAAGPGTLSTMMVSIWAIRRSMPRTMGWQVAGAASSWPSYADISTPEPVLVRFDGKQRQAATMASEGLPFTVWVSAGVVRGTVELSQQNEVIGTYIWSSWGDESTDETGTLQQRLSEETSQAHNDAALDGAVDLLMWWFPVRESRADVSFAIRDNVEPRQLKLQAPCDGLRHLG